MFALRIKVLNIFTAYSFECYVCNGKTEEECTSKQTKVNCTGDDCTCWKANYKTEKDKTGEIRGCLPKKSCKEIKKKCDDGEEMPQDDGDKITKCDVACCVTAAGAENPCNGAITVSANVVMMIFAALYALNLF